MVRAGEQNVSEEGPGTTDWGKFIENIVDTISFVSSYYRYEEEYILTHSPEWLNRKYKQAVKEQWEKGQTRIQEGIQSLIAFADLAFNQGKNLKDILPESFEEALALRQEVQKVTSDFIEGEWWKEKN